MEKHPSTGDPMLSSDYAQMTCETVPFDPCCPIQRVNIFNGDEVLNEPMATVVWISWTTVNTIVNHQKGVEVNCHQLFNGFSTMVSQEETFSRCGKKSAAGPYQEVGFGAGPGKQTRVCDLSPLSSPSPSPSSSPSSSPLPSPSIPLPKTFFFPYYRNPTLSDHLQPHIAKMEAIITILFNQLCPDLAKTFSRPSSHFSRVLTDALSYPQPPNEGVLKDAELLFFGSQRAIRPAGLPNDPSTEYVDFAKKGGSGLHTDSKDPIRKPVGSLMYYACFLDDDDFQSSR